MHGTGKASRINGTPCTASTNQRMINFEVHGYVHIKRTSSSFKFDLSISFTDISYIDFIFF